MEPAVAYLTLRRARDWAVLAGLALAYIVLGRAALTFAAVHVSASPLWPPSGLALAAVLILGYRASPAVLVGALVVNATAGTGLLTSAGIAVGNTLEALLAAWLVNRWAAGVHVFDRPRHLTVFAFGAVAGAVVAATAGVTSLVLSGSASWRDYQPIWFTWWLGDAAGAVVVAPLLLLWWLRPEPDRLRRRAREAGALALLLLLSGLAVFGGILPAGFTHLPVAFVVIPSLVWAAFRFGPRETATALAILSAVAAVGTLRGHGPFAVAPPNESLLLLQAFMGTMMLTMLSVASVVRRQRRVEASLRTRAAQYRALADAMPQMVFTATPDGRWDYSNARWREYTGMTAAESDGDGWQAAIHPDDRPGCRERWLRAVREGTAFDLELRFRRADGVYRWHLGRAVPMRVDGGRVLQWIGTGTDVEEARRTAAERERLLTAEQTARARAELAQRRWEFLAQAGATLAASLDYEATLKQLVRLAVPEIADGCMVDLLDENGRLQRVAVSHRDPAVEALSWELWKRYPEPHAHPIAQTARDGAPRVCTDVTDAVLSTFAVDDEHLRLLHRPWLRSYLVVPLRARGDLLGAFSLVAGESGRRYGADDLPLAEELARRAAQAIDNARLYRRAETSNRAKDEFLAMLAHELRNPLAAARNALAVLDRPGSAEDVALRARAIIGRQIGHLARMIDDLLDVARLTSGKVLLVPQPLDLADTVSRCVGVLRDAGSLDGHRVELALEPVWTSADVTRLEQIVTNLLTNAVKFTPEGGTIRLQTALEGDHAVLVVSDTGIGIAPELLPRIFDLFIQGERTLDRSQGGLGVGLTLVRRLVEMHGGRVEAHSAGRGQGAEFVVRLPRIAAQRPAGRPAPEPGQGSGRRVLVVEDNADAREMLRVLLEASGHVVQEAPDGYTACDIATRLEPEVALVDIGLPGLDGYEVARRLRASRPSLRLLAITGYGQPDDRRRSAQAGFDGHLLKPVDPDLLLRLVARP